MTSLHKPAMFNLVHILTGMRRSGKTFQLFQLITEYKKRWASAHADAHLECPYSSAEHGSFRARLSCKDTQGGRLHVQMPTFSCIQ